MVLGLIDSLITLGTVILIAVLGYWIDRSGQPHKKL